MAIFDRQYKTMLSNEMLKYLLLGRNPNVRQISEKVTNALGKDGKITYQYTPQFPKTTFNIGLYNKALEQLKFDVDILHEEIMALFNKSMSRVTYADLYNKVHSHQLNNLDSLLQALLFSVENADFYFLGAFDNFTDTSKLDQEASTPNIIDMGSQSLALPQGGRGTDKIRTNHLYGRDTWPIDIRLPTPESVVSSRHAPGYSFSNMFTDVLSAWVYEVKTSQNGPCEIRFRVPIAGPASAEAEVFVNKLTFIPHVPKKETLSARVSNDDVNYLELTGYENGLVLDTQRKVYSMDFETNLVQFVEITIRKDTADSEVTENGQKVFQYLFGLKNMSAYRTGRVSTARYQSKPFDFSGSTEQISNVSITTTSERPKGTNIFYSVALANDAGKTTDFIPIKPLGKAGGRIGVNEIVRFNTTQNKVIKLVAPKWATVLYGSRFQAKSFYRIGPKISPPPVFGSAFLYRGENLWTRDSSSPFKTIEVDDVFLSFQGSDIEAVYTTKKEVPQYQNINTNRAVQLTLTRPPYYNADRGHLIKPDPSKQGAGSDIGPNYAIYSIKQVSSRNRVSFPFTLPSTNTVDLPATNFVIQSSNSEDLPVISGGGVNYVPNVDYVFETESIGGVEKPTGRFTIPSGSRIANSSGSVLRFTYTPDPDITHKAIRISGNYVTLENAIIQRFDNIEIEYRYIPLAPSEILKSSVRISEQPSSGNARDFFVEGSDYVFDVTTGTVQRIPNGNIPESGAVYAQFTYRDAENDIETFQIWCNINTPEGIKIFFDLDPSTKNNKLVSDSDVGESFLVNSPEGLIDLTNATNTPTLGPGFVQFIVRSKNPDSNTTYGTNLIDQVIQMRDANKRRIFRSNNQYFSEVTGFTAPMKQRTLNHLKVNTLKSDHSVFAVDDITSPGENYIVVNFIPGETDELYMKVPSGDSEEDTTPSEGFEKFLFVWTTKVSEDAIDGNKVVVRIDLERLPSQSDGGITPKVHSYNLRAGS